MTYKDRIAGAMTKLGKNENVVFLGEGIINAGRIYNTLDGVPTDKCIEMPIAENLIVGAAIGLAIGGYKPVVVFQRMDFMLCAADAIINHLSLIPKMSGDRIHLPVIIRAIIGSQDKKFCVGEQHNKDLTHIFKPYIYTIRLGKTESAEHYYDIAYQSMSPTLIIEEKDLYETEIKDEDPTSPARS